jgi:saccharopine dehydrogenase (NAD+, L-lysine-forming)
MMLKLPDPEAMLPSGRVLLYGATGFSGRLLAERLNRQGIDLVLAGRNPVRVAAIAERLSLDFRIFSLEDSLQIDYALEDIKVVLHAAGPYRRTALPMMRACIRTGTHYLDLAGEWQVFQQAIELGAAAASNAVMLMPGIGFSIVASDCLLSLAAESSRDTVALRLAISTPEVMSRGTFRSMLQLTSSTVMVRRNRQLMSLPVGSLSRYFDFGSGLRPAVAVNWPDVITSHFTSIVPTIEAYAEADWSIQAAYLAFAKMAPLNHSAAGQTVLSVLSQLWPEAPSPKQRRRSQFILVVEAEDRWHRTHCFRMQTLDGYTVTEATASEIVQRVLNDHWLSGFRTPASLYGSSLILDTGCAFRVPLNKDQFQSSGESGRE